MFALRKIRGSIRKAIQGKAAFRAEAFYPTETKTVNFELVPGPVRVGILSSIKRGREYSWTNASGYSASICQKGGGGTSVCQITFVRGRANDATGFERFGLGIASRRRDNLLLSYRPFWAKFHGLTVSSNDRSSSLILPRYKLIERPLSAGKGIDFLNR